MKHRKAQALKWADVMFGIFAIIFVAALMTYMSFQNIKIIKNRITEFEIGIDAQNDLIMILNQPIFFDANKDGTQERVTVADLLDYSYENNDYSDFEKRLEEHFTPKYKTVARTWRLNIYTSDGTRIKSFTERLSSGQVSSKATATVLFPIKSQNKPLKIVFFVESAK